MAKAPTFRRKRAPKAGETPETPAADAGSDAGMLNTEPSVVMPKTPSIPPVAEQQRATARADKAEAKAEAKDAKEAKTEAKEPAKAEPALTPATPAAVAPPPAPVAAAPAPQAPAPAPKPAAPAATPPAPTPRADAGFNDQSSDSDRRDGPRQIIMPPLDPRLAQFDREIQKTLAAKPQMHQPRHQHKQHNQHRPHNQSFNQGNQNFNQGNQGNEQSRGYDSAARRDNYERPPAGSLPPPNPAGPMGTGAQAAAAAAVIAARVSSSDDVLDAETQLRYEQAKKQDISVRDLQRMTVEQLHELARQENIADIHTLKKHDLIFQVLKSRITRQGLMYGEGVLEVLPDGFGFLRSPEYSYLACPDDIYVSPSQIRRFGLKPGHIVQGTIRPPKESEKYFALLRVDAINGNPPDSLNDIPNFEDLTPLHPYERYVLEAEPDGIEMRIVDLVAPLGRGQRALIVAPPRTGKTILLQKMANSLIKNYPEVKIIVLLIDERPEEVTDFRNNTPKEVEVVASTFDEESKRHVQVCNMVSDKARRMVEFGDHVVILLDSITRMARAYNTEMPHSGKILTGGLDSNALQLPKKFFGSARAIEGGGSLTIVGTALVDTNSKMDDIIFEEFKGTGNSELHLDRRLVEKRVWPAIDIAGSGTRREELLLDKREHALVCRLRKILSDMNVVEAMELLRGRLMKVRTNAEFLLTMNLD
jgi:transcription termination factor Rho